MNRTGAAAPVTPALKMGSGQKAVSAHHDQVSVSSLRFGRRADKLASPHGAAEAR